MIRSGAKLKAFVINNLHSSERFFRLESVTSIRGMPCSQITIEYQLTGFTNDNMEVKHAYSAWIKVTFLTGNTALFNMDHVEYIILDEDNDRE